MYSSSVIFGVWLLGIAINGGVHCDTIEFQPGFSYSWIIPPKNQPSPLGYGYPSSLPAAQDRPSAKFDQPNESPLKHFGGYGHPPFILRHSHEQLSLPNEFLITPSDPQREGSGGYGGDDAGSGDDGRGVSFIMPLFQQLDPVLMNKVDCDGDPNCPNVDITEQQRPTTIHQSNIASIPGITPRDYHQQRSSPPALSWPSIHGGGFGLLFHVPESASHLTVEQLIRQQLGRHLTRSPFDISINCKDAVGSGCLPSAGGSGITLLEPPPPLPSSGITRNRRNVQNGDFASTIQEHVKRRLLEQRRQIVTIGGWLLRNNPDRLKLKQQH